MQNSEQNLYNNLIRQIDRYKHYCHEGSYKTRERYYNSCKRFCEFLAVEFRAQKFLNVNEKHIFAYAEHMKSYKAAATIRTELSAIRKVYEWLGGTNKLPGNEKLDLPERLVGVFDKSWTPEEYSRAIALGKSMGRDDVYYGLKIAWVYGTRIKEACALRVYQIKEAVRNEGLEIKGKGGQVRVIPIRTEEQKQMLAELMTYIKKRNLQPGDYIIAGQFKGGVQKAIKRIQNWIYNHRSKFMSPDRALEVRDGKRQRNEKITFHGLRHEYAQRLVANLKNKGNSYKTARLNTSEAMGHHRITITTTYFDDLPARKKKK